MVTTRDAYLFPVRLSRAVLFPGAECDLENADIGSVAMYFSAEKRCFFTANNVRIVYADVVTGAIPDMTRERMWLTDQSQSCGLRAACVALTDSSENLGDARKHASTQARKRACVATQGALACLASLRVCVKSEYKAAFRPRFSRHPHSQMIRLPT